jgi:hypothetical protein
MIYLGEKVHDENDDTAFIISILPNDQPPLTSPPSSPNLTTSTEVIQDTAKVLFMTKQVRSRKIWIRTKIFPFLDNSSDLFDDVLDSF